MAHPIWQDVIYKFNAESAEFSISHNGTIIYEGKAYRKPGAQFVEIKINDICADYFRNSFPSEFPDTSTEEQSYIYTFTIEADLYNGTTVVESVSREVELFYDWSYSNVAQLWLLSAPILRKIPRNAPFVCTATEAVNISDSDIEVAEGKKANIVIADIGGSAINIIGEAPDEELSYEVVDSCYRYMLYYLNAFGGWDFLLIEGKELQSDNYTRYTLGQSYDNAQYGARGTRNYRNDVVRKWQLHTLWIDDAGAQNMHHLLGSTDVFLYDITSQELHPITLDNSVCEYKTYSNNGNQLVRYDIEATLAQTITRR